MGSSRKAWMIVLGVLGSVLPSAYVWSRLQPPPAAARAAGSGDCAERIRQALADQTAAMAVLVAKRDEDGGGSDRRPTPARGTIQIAPVRVGNVVRATGPTIAPATAARPVVPAATPAPVVPDAPRPPAAPPATAPPATAPPATPTVTIADADAGALRRRGDALAEQGKLDEALEAFRTAVRLDPNDPLAFRGAGLAYARKGELARGIGLLAKAVDLAPADVELRCQKGSAEAAAGRRADAMATYAAALKADPARAGLVFVYAGESHLRWKEWPAAARTFRRALAREPGNARAHLGLGSAHEAAGDPAAARAAWQDAARLDPDGAAGTAARDRLKHLAGSASHAAVGR